MPSDNRLGSRVPKFADPTSIVGAKLDSGPYIGIVRNNADPARSGRLKVWIPDFGGTRDEETHWITVSYASPYMGSTRWSRDNGERPTDNVYEAVNHTYGMWFTPPDLGNQILITFVAGDINRGYWFACVMPELSHYAIPGQAGSDYVVTDDPNLASVLTNPPYPTVEFNEENKELKNKWNQFLTINKPIHKEQAKILLRQGLEDDKTRGVISSSSQRESPSTVFGVSTPGLPSSSKDPVTGAPRYRSGGHTFVMDDGYQDQQGLVRLRTAGGHQIMMNDADEVIYIASSKGDTWMEFSKDGKFNVYSKNDISMRTEGNYNIHSDADINMYAKGDIKMKAGNNIQEEAEIISLKAFTELKVQAGKIGILSQSTLALQAATQGSFGSGTELVFGSGMIYLNTQAPPTVDPIVKLPTRTYKDTGATKPAPYYKWKAGKKLAADGTIKDYGVTTTIPTPIPTHEPWEYEHPTAVSQRTGSTGAQPTATTVPTVPTTGDSAGPAAAQGKGVSKPASAADYAAQPPQGSGIGTLTADETRALKAQISKSESGGNYAAENQLGYIGRYQFGALALIDQGYVAKGTTNRGLSTPSNWLNKDGLNSKEAFWAAHDIQEKIMDANLTMNYKIMVKLGTLTASSPADDVAGKLSVSHLLGAGGCNKWSKGLGGSDANGTTGDTYYNRGRYAITVLAKSTNPDVTT